MTDRSQSRKWVKYTKLPHCEYHIKILWAIISSFLEYKFIILKQIIIYHMTLSVSAKLEMIKFDGFS